MSLKLLALLGSLALTLPAHAYYAVLDNGEVLSEGRYKVTGDLQAITDGGGMNVGGRFDLGFKDEFGARGVIGTGVTDFFVAGFFKWMPIPDVSGQPAIGANAGVVFATDDGVRDLTFRLEPLVSKKFSVSSLTWTPYASVPIGLRARNSSAETSQNVFVAQAVVGTQLQIQRWKNLQFMAELGLDLREALSHVAVAAVFYFDRENGVKLE